MIFTKREERQAIGKPQEIRHTDVIANVQIRIAANQGPKDPEEKRGWCENIREFFTNDGYEARLYYRHAGGHVTGGEVHQDIDSASDLLLCSKALLPVGQGTRPFESKVDGMMAISLRNILDQDELWELSK